MKTRFLNLTAAAVVLIIAATPLAAQEAATDKGLVPVTDPLELENMGFAWDTHDVYAMPSAFNGVEHGALPEDRRTDEKSFGTDGFGMTTVGGTAFQPIGSATSGYGTAGHADRYCTGGNPYFDAPVEALPHGARIHYLDQWWYDNSAENLETWLWATCTATNGADPSNSLLKNTESSGTPGSAFNVGVSVIGHDVNTERCHYWIRVRLNNDGASCSEALDLRMRKARVYWKRQVEPAPASATFSDVGTGHPFFQHVEALADSGITAGCGGGNYCPDAPLTRGQMAVFLSKALGLNWGSDL